MVKERAASGVVDVQLVEEHELRALEQFASRVRNRVTGAHLGAEALLEAAEELVKVHAPLRALSDGGGVKQLAKQPRLTATGGPVDVHPRHGRLGLAGRPRKVKQGNDVLSELPLGRIKRASRGAEVNAREQRIERLSCRDRRRSLHEGPA